MSRSRHRKVQWKHKRNELPDWKLGCPSPHCDYCAAKGKEREALRQDRKHGSPWKDVQA